MAETTAKLGYGTSLGIWNGSSYANLIEITDLKLPDFVRDSIEATNMASPDENREYIAGLMGVGTLEVEMNYIPSAADVVLAAQVAGIGQFKVTFPGGVNWVFKGNIEKYSAAAPLDNKMTATASIQVTNRGTWAAS